MNNDKSLFFLTISLVCVWLILDNFLGKKYVNSFLNKMFSFMDLETGIKVDSTAVKMGENKSYTFQYGMSDEDVEKLKQGEHPTDENGKKKIFFVF